jgi:hypothetical protein
VGSRAEACRLVRPHAAQERRAEHGAGELCRHVGRGVAHGEVPGDRERDGDGRIDVRARQVTNGVDHRHDRQAERRGDADRAERRVSRLIDDEGAAAGEDERERGDQLGGGASDE